MSEEPANAPPTPEPTARLPVVVTPAERKPSDLLARLLGVLALTCSVGTGAYIAARPAPLPSPITPEIWQATQQRTTALTEELAVLRQNLQTLQTAPPATVATGGMTAEQTQGLQEEIDKLRATLTEIKGGITSATAVQQDMTQLKNDLAVANTAIAAMHDQVRRMTATAHKAAEAEDTTRAQVIAYFQLRNAAATATPFADELQKLTDTARAVPNLPHLAAKLENAAHAGVATLPMLQARFNVMSGPAEQAIALAAAQTWWDKLAANIQEVVSIRKVGRDGSGPDKALHDAAAALQRGNIADAVAQVAKLPPVAQTHMQEWLTDANARIALDATLAQIGVLLGQSAPRPDDSQPSEHAKPESHKNEPQKPESGKP
ncbi:MAG: hypothetical protein WBK91_10510 [Alphaproteobacteria bacterium]